MNYELKLKASDVLCREGDPSMDLYFLKSGRLMVCTVKGTEVKALARISPGKFLGELSFFDGRIRSSNVIALEDSVVLQIPRQLLSQQLPEWLSYVCKNLTKKIRVLDHVLQDGHLRKYGEKEQAQLSVEEQRKYYEILTKS